MGLCMNPGGPWAVTASLGNEGGLYPRLRPGAEPGMCHRSHGITVSPSTPLDAISRAAEWNRKALSAAEICLKEKGDTCPNFF